MSEQAKQNFNKEILQELEENYKVISSDLRTIEKIGGGSARCMVAEIF